MMECRIIETFKMNRIIKTHPSLIVVGSILTMCLFSMGLTGCYYDVESELYGADCSDATATFNTTIKNIFVQHCQSCHSGAAPNGNLLLTQYSEIGDATLHGAVIDRISRPAGSAGAMPPSGNIDVCKIELIKQWALNGVPE